MKIVENRKKIFAASAAVYAVGIILIIIHAASGRGAFNLDVEFSGGLSINANIGSAFENDDIAAIVTEVTGQAAPQVQKIGSATAGIKIREVEPEKRQELVKKIAEKYGLGEDSFEVSDISATVSGEMQRNAVIAVLLSCAAMLVYISMRFRDVRIGSSIIITLMFDALFTVLCYGALRVPLNNSFIAVVLTIIGCAVNDNIVVFDRVRENKRNLKRLPVGELINKSVSQSLRRCLFTSVTTLVTITALFILGVPSMKQFTGPLILGMICGFFASILFNPAMYYTMCLAGEEKSGEEPPKITKSKRANKKAADV
ncbi:MAG: protein translocase subunit SecF [Clostridiales bacterium]|jgi:preprotein translocase SecF subunit|nr:protein translocase subunit SecF [Clostridiales bacterium]